MTGNEMVGWHQRLDGHEFEQALGVDGGQGSLACCSPWGRKEQDTIYQLNNKDKIIKQLWQFCSIKALFDKQLLTAFLLCQISKQLT